MKSEDVAHLSLSLLDSRKFLNLLANQKHAQAAPSPNVPYPVRHTAAPCYVYHGMARVGSDAAGETPHTRRIARAHTYCTLKEHGTVVDG